MSERAPFAPKWIYSNPIRLIVAAVAGIAAALISLTLKLPPMAPLVGWDIAVAVYFLWILTTVFRLDGDATATLASREDPGIVGADLLMVVASVASLGAVGATLIDAGKEQGPEKTILVLVSIVSVVLSWLLIHTLFTLRYARLYFDEGKKGIDFGEDSAPCYSDFAYLAFTVGMTFQVSDTPISDKRIRRSVLHHSLLSYLFGTVIVATTINLVAGLGK